MVTETQYCPRCDKHVPLDDYHPGKQGRPGNYCRPCTVDYKREWRRARGQRTREELRRRCGQDECDEPPASKKARYCTAHRPVWVPSTGYRAVHKRVAKARGTAAEHGCAHCPAQAEQWAYDHDDPDAITGRTDRGVVAAYSLDPYHYLPLCRSCHVKMDGNGRARYEGSALHILNEQRANAIHSHQPKLVSNW